MITIHILLDISKSKGKQAIKFGQLKEFNMRNIFLIDCFKKSKFSLSLDQHSKILTDKLRCLPLAFTSSNHFCKKQEEVWNQSPCIKFYMILAKNNYVIYSINWPIFMASLSWLLEILGNMCIVFICSTAHDIANFEIKIVFLYDQQSQDKNLNILITDNSS